jgi:hypothetical protein
VRACNTLCSWSLPTHTMLPVTAHGIGEQLHPRSLHGLSGFSCPVCRLLCALGAPCIILTPPSPAHVVCPARSYEQAVLAEGQGGEKQVEAVRQLFHRQLQTPQPAAQQLLQEYEEWERETGQVRGAGLLICMRGVPA